MCKVNVNQLKKEKAVLKKESHIDTLTSAQAAPKAVVLKTEPIGDILSIRGKLHLLGWKSFTAWANAHGYKRTAVSAAVRAWGQRTDRAPHGGISRAVMHDLRQTLTEGLRPQETANHDVSADPKKFGHDSQQTTNKSF